MSISLFCPLPSARYHVQTVVQKLHLHPFTFGVDGCAPRIVFDQREKLAIHFDIVFHITAQVGRFTHDALDMGVGRWVDHHHFWPNYQRDVLPNFEVVVGGGDGQGAAQGFNG